MQSYIIIFQSTVLTIHYFYPVKLRSYFKNVSLLFIVNFAIKPIWVFGIERKFQLILGQEAYGKYFSYLSLIYIFSVLLDMGLHNYAVKSISEKKEDYKQYIAELWVSKGILVIVYLTIVFIAILIQKMDITNALIFFLIAIEMLIFSLYQFLRCFTQGFQLLRLDSILSSLDRVLLILIGGGILFLYTTSSSISLIGFIGFHILAYSLAFIGVYFILRRRISFSMDTLSGNQLIQIVREGFPLLVIVFLMTIYSRIDVVLLKNLVLDGNYQCGILAYSNKIIDSAYNTLALLSVFLIPTIAYHYSEKKYNYVQKVVLISFGISTLMALGFITLSLLFSKDIYTLLYPSSDELAINVFRVQTWTVLGIGWMYVFGSYLTATSRYTLLIIIVFIGVLISLGLNYYYIPTQKVMGVAYVSAAVHLTMGILHMIAAFYYLFKSKTR